MLPPQINHGTRDLLACRVELPCRLERREPLLLQRLSLGRSLDALGADQLGDGHHICSLLAQATCRGRCELQLLQDKAIRQLRRHEKVHALCECVEAERERANLGAEGGKAAA